MITGHMGECLYCGAEQGVRHDVDCPTREMKPASVLQRIRDVMTRTNNFINASDTPPHLKDEAQKVLSALHGMELQALELGKDGK